MGRHANTYLLLFSHPFLVESLLRDFVPGEWLRDLDFSSLEKVGASYATDDLRSRHDDLVWRLRSRHDGQWVYVYLLLEFQSTDDYFMAIRVMTYEGLLYEDLIRRQDLKRDDPLPPILPIVLYNGHQRWKSPTDTVALVPQVPTGFEAFRPRVNYLLLDEGAFQAPDLDALPSPVARLFRLEHADPDELLAEVTRLRTSLQGPEHQELRRAFVTCILAILRRRLEGIRFPETQELEEIENMIAEKAPTWTEMWEEQGREKGRKEGRKEGEYAMLERLLERRFGVVDEPARQRGRMDVAHAGVEDAPRIDPRVHAGDHCLVAFGHAADCSRRGSGGAARRCEQSTDDQGRDCERCCRLHGLPLWPLRGRNRVKQVTEPCPRWDLRLRRRSHR